MTDTNNLNIDSPSSVSLSSSSSSSSSSLDGSIKIRIKSSIAKSSTTKRRSQRRRTNTQPPMRSSSLATTILHADGHINESISDTNNNPKIEKHSSLDSIPKLVFTTTSTTNSKSSYWTVTDREAEWYKLSIPVNRSTSNQTVPYKKLSKIFTRENFHSNNNSSIDRPTDTTQLIMKAVMHELDYDMDNDDLKFLNELNQYNRTKQRRQISEEEFENAILILEFSTAEKIRSHLKQKSCEGEDIVCNICLLPDGDDGNEMVFCERCNCCVHQNCYGIPTIPSGTWLCRPCSILRRPACILCPKRGGPLKCTASGTIWCHLTCVLWLPELKFVDYVKMEPVLYLNKIPHARWSLRCVVCSTSEGACVQCAHKNCRTLFHVTCGLSAGYFLDIQQTFTKEFTTSRSQFNAYCSKHSEEARKRSEQDPLPKQSDKEEDPALPLRIPFTVYHRDQLKTNQWINECYKKFSSFISSSYFHKECPHDFNENVSKKIYEYWIRKRQSNQTMPLIKHIDYVLEQRENSELLITQINHHLKMRRKILQLQTRCKSVLDSSPSSAILTQRFESLKKTFLSSIHRRRSLSILLNDNDHENENKIKLFKRHRYSTEHYATNERARQCMVQLESTYRHNLELNTTYLIGKTLEGQMFLLPKQLIEQANIIALADNDQQANIVSSMDYSDISDDEDMEPLRKKGMFKTSKTTYTSQGNVVTCITGSFD